ncbi:MAG: FAD-dependent thymidylate synthase [Calditrichota bacterium]
MQVTLAGVNLDMKHVDLVRRIRDEYLTEGPGSHRFDELMHSLGDDPLTPETISAAYARISRSERGIQELRRDAFASVNRARRSNENIIFGLGHTSVAEHAVFNLDITGASRLAIEDLESHRLASYTESSQRYISHSGDYIVPDEIRSVGLENEFDVICRGLFKAYREIDKKLETYYESPTDKEHTGKTREDARYVLPLACRGQVGMTINARSAESMIRNFSQSILSEVRFLGAQMLEELRFAAPSLMRYVEPSPKFAPVERWLRAEVARTNKETSADTCQDDVQLIEAPQRLDRLAVAALLFKSGESSYEAVLNYIESLDEAARTRLMREAHRHLETHDSLRRELELGYFTYSITLSASAFAQLKRHRMATLIKQDYLPELGVTIPTAVQDANLTAEFNQAILSSEWLYTKLTRLLDDSHQPAASYILTNAHRRRVIFQANARELTHLSRLRLDQSAQWDIRRLVNEIIAQARNACPVLLMFACGKDEFEGVVGGLMRGKS